MPLAEPPSLLVNNPELAYTGHFTAYRSGLLGVCSAAALTDPRGAGVSLGGARI